MKRLRTDRNIRAILTVLMLIVWPSPVLEARQVSPPPGGGTNRYSPPGSGTNRYSPPGAGTNGYSPPGTGTTRNCEAERCEQYWIAWLEYQDALTLVEVKKRAAIAGCQDAFDNVDVKDCHRKAEDAMKTVAAGLSIGYLTCAGICAAVATPAGVVIATPCLQCLAALSTATASGLANAEIIRASCLAGAKDKADKCGRDALRTADVAIADADIAYKGKLRKADIAFDQCKANAGG